MGLFRKIIGFKLNGLKIRYLSGVKSALVNLILQFLDFKGPYNVVENHGPALLDEGQIFGAEAQKEVLDSYTQFILEFFTEENRMKEKFSIHRSIQMGEHWMTHRAYKDLQRRRKSLEAMYVRAQVPFPGLLPLSLLEKDGHCDSDRPLKGGGVQEIRVWKTAREIEHSGYRAFMFYLEKEIAAVSSKTGTDYRFKDCTVRYTSFAAIGLDALYDSGPFEHPLGYFFPNDFFLVKRTVAIGNQRCFVAYRESLSLGRFDVSERVNSYAFNVHGADLEASLEELETVYILLVKHLHAEFGGGRSAEFLALRSFFLKYQEVSGLRTNGLMALSLLLLFDLGFTLDLPVFKDKWVSTKDNVFEGGHPRNLPVYFMKVRARSAISGLLLFKDIKKDVVFELKFHSVDLLVLLNQEPELKPFLYNTLFKCCHAAVASFCKHPKLLPFLPRKVFK